MSSKPSVWCNDPMVARVGSQTEMEAVGQNLSTKFRVLDGPQAPRSPL